MTKLAPHIHVDSDGPVGEPEWRSVHVVEYQIDGKKVVYGVFSEVNDANIEINDAIIDGMDGTFSIAPTWMKDYR